MFPLLKYPAYQMPRGIFANFFALAGSEALTAIDDWKTAFTMCHSSA
jgi:hypothetical protein